MALIPYPPKPAFKKLVAYNIGDTIPDKAVFVTTLGSQLVYEIWAEEEKKTTYGRPTPDYPRTNA